VDTGRIINMFTVIYVAIYKTLSSLSTIKSPFIRTLYKSARLFFLGKGPIIKGLELTNHFETFSKEVTENQVIGLNRGLTPTTFTIIIRDLFALFTPTLT